MVASSPGSITPGEKTSADPSFIRISSTVHWPAEGGFEVVKVTVWTVVPDEVRYRATSVQSAKLRRGVCPPLTTSKEVRVPSGLTQRGASVR